MICRWTAILAFVQFSWTCFFCLWNRTDSFCCYGSQSQLLLLSLLLKFNYLVVYPSAMTIAMHVMCVCVRARGWVYIICLHALWLLSIPSCSYVWLYRCIHSTPYWRYIEVASRGLYQYRAPVACPHFFGANYWTKNMCYAAPPYLQELIQIRPYLDNNHNRESTVNVSWPQEVAKWFHEISKCLCRNMIYYKQPVWLTQVHQSHNFQKRLGGRNLNLFQTSK